MQIVEFSPEYASAFERLNVEWLEKYFWVEDIDRVILANPQSEVIDHGGHILFAVDGERAVGTVALKHHGNGHFELTKMGVTESYQGRGLGRALMAAAVDRFLEIQGSSLFLETNSILSPAIALYESAGFRHAPHPKPSDYERSDTYMVYDPD
mgnify:CR=1 FL=1